LSSIVIFLDPALLAFFPTLTREEFIARVSFLATWAEIVRTSDLGVHIAPGVTEYLVRNNLFPAHNAISSVLDALDLRYRFAPEDLISPVNTILSRAGSSLYCCAKDADHHEFSSTPPQPWHGNQDANYQSQRAVLLARVEQLIHGSPSNLVLASLLPDDYVTFSATLDLMDPEELPGLSPGELPRMLEGALKNVQNFEHVVNCRTADELWREASDNRGIKQAIKVRCREKLIERRTYKSFDDLPEFHVGPDFYPSLLRNQAAGAGRFASVTLEACATAVLKLPILEWRKFDKPSRKVDGAEPMRAHLTESGVAIRLMAWFRHATPAGTVIEFSNIGNKWEEEISNTSPTEAL
jgi:hypothetical protein